MSMLNCPSCGAQNAKMYRFCLNCGEELPQPSQAVEPTPPPTSRRSSVGDILREGPTKKPSINTLISRVDKISEEIYEASSNHFFVHKAGSFKSVQP